MQKDMQNKNETLANRLADILMRLNSGEQLIINGLAENYDAHPKTISRDFLRFESCNFPTRKEGIHFSLNPAYLVRLKIKNIQTFVRISSWMMVDYCYPVE